LVEKRKHRLFQIKADAGKYLFLGFMIALFRPSVARHHSMKINDSYLEI
jgi:hypothetical protein